MGCDIHGVIERRTAYGWKRLEGAYFPNNRNYDVFAILADVRNGRGFAGVKIGEGFDPIAESRGLPDGYTPDKYSSDDFWLGDHSYSWLTLREVFEYDYEQTTTLCGVRSLAAFAKFEYQRENKREWHRELPCPDSWSGDVSGGGSATLSETEGRAA